MPITVHVRFKFMLITTVTRHWEISIGNSEQTPFMVWDRFQVFSFGWTFSWIDRFKSFHSKRTRSNLDYFSSAILA